MIRTAVLLAIYGLLWGGAVELADAALGDPFEPLDVFTLAVQVALAILLWPFARRILSRPGEPE